jgi:hypothetical protein
MQKLKSLKVAHEDLLESLQEWLLQKRKFEEEDWPERDYAPYFKIFLRIEESADRIRELVGIVKHLPEFEGDEVLSFIDLKRQCRDIQEFSLKMSNSLSYGTDALLDHCKAPSVFLSWKGVCAAVDSFARSAARELKGLQSKYRDASDSSLLYYASLGLENMAEDAMKCSKRISNRRNRERSEKFSNRRNFED